MDFDWLIVGGGIHGVHIAVRLVDDGGVDPARLCIVDPGVRLLQRWRERAQATGMAYLRSPLMHHLDTHPYSLARFASEPHDAPMPLFIAPNGRPATGLFDAHCDHVIDRVGLAERHVRDRVEEIEAGADATTVRLTSGATLRAGKLVLALGADGQPELPDWTSEHETDVAHVFDTDLESWSSGRREVAVVGGGITAAQVALRLARDGHQVALISRHPVRIRQYDSEPGWFGPKHMRGFERLRDLRARRDSISGGRHRGSMPPDVHAALEAASARGDVQRYEAEIEEVDGQDGRLRISLAGGEAVDVDGALLATGVAPGRPGGELVDGLVATASLPCAPCGYPVLDAALRWHPRIHVTGPLAELTIGPVARNIAGARRAADRIVGSLPGSAEQAGPELDADARVESYP
ncbi:MAG: FAD/NAD(P)-binding protein [Planctomycetota bacterium]